MKNAVIVGAGVMGLLTVATVGYSMVKKCITTNDTTDVAAVSIIENVKYTVEEA